MHRTYDPRGLSDRLEALQRSEERRAGNMRFVNRGMLVVLVLGTLCVLSAYGTEGLIEPPMCLIVIFVYLVWAFAASRVKSLHAADLRRINSAYPPQGLDS